jgi:folate-dependent phosphoribosylglycinamide formyltransferase PurN
MSAANQIVVLTVPSPPSWVLVNAVVERFGPVTILAEEREPKRDLIRRRMRQQGVMTVIGQIGFVLLQKFIEKRAQGRIAEIVSTMKLNVNAPGGCEIIPVRSVNSMACRAALAMLAPKAVLVIGTRMIGKETLAAIKVPIINSHAGWNPKYRGQAGGYWAMAYEDAEHAGVTVHLVDQGVDTGDILYHDRFAATPADSFPTYFYIQAGVARFLVIKALEDALAGTLKPFRGEPPSNQFFHPTLWGYLWTAWRKGVW